MIQATEELMTEKKNKAPNYPEEIQSFLENYVLFRENTYSWQDIMRLDPEIVEWKVKAETFGKEHLIGYNKNTLGKILYETPEGNHWLQVDYRYDQPFMKAYVEMVKKKLVLLNNEGVNYIDGVEKFQNQIKEQYEKGYLAMGPVALVEIFPMFLEIGSAERLLISEVTMQTLACRGNDYYKNQDKYKKCYWQLMDWQRKGKFPTPLKKNEDLVTRKAGFLNLKTIHPSSEDLEMSCFLPSVKQGLDILYVGYGWQHDNQGHWGVPFYSFPENVAFDIKLEMVMGDSKEDLLELNNKVVYLPKLSNGYYDYLYHG